MRPRIFSLIVAVSIATTSIAQQAFTFKETVYGQTHEVIRFDQSLFQEVPALKLEQDEFVTKIHAAVESNPEWYSMTSHLYVVSSDTPIEDSVVVSSTNNLRCLGQIKNQVYTLQHYVVFNKGLTFNYVEIGQDVRKVFGRLKLEVPRSFTDGVVEVYSADKSKKIYFRFKAGALVEMGW